MQVALAQMLHRAVIRHAISIVVSDLGCSEELVSSHLLLSATITCLLHGSARLLFVHAQVEEQDPVFLYLAGNGDVLGCLVCEKVNAACAVRARALELYAA